MSTINQFINYEKGLYKKAESAAFHAIRPKTESQSMLTEFNFSMTFRYIFSFVSWSLYIPFFLELIFKSEGAINYTVIVAAFLILTSIELALLYFTSAWYNASHYDNKHQYTHLKKISYILSIISILASVYSGVYGVLSSDNSVKKIQDESNNVTNNVRNEYFSQINANNDKIKENNSIIKSYSGIALTKIAKKYISDLNEMNKNLELSNENIRSEMNTINSKHVSNSDNTINSANQKKWLFALIFLIAGIFCVLGIHYCYKTISLFHHKAGKELLSGNILNDSDNDLKKALSESELSSEKIDTKFVTEQKKNQNLSWN